MTAPSNQDGSPEGPMSPHRVTVDDPSAGPAPHIPVALPQMLAALAPAAGETYIDATFGAGGYSSAILQTADCRVLALDRDAQVVRDAQSLIQSFTGRLTVVEAPFSRIEDVARVTLSTTATPQHPSVFTPPDGIVLDIGVSSMQLDQPERGFSFMRDGPLDMRMSATGPNATGRTAADIVNETAEADLADILFELGEERRSRAIARAIVRAREAGPITTTGQLARLVEKALGGRRGEARHPATRTFQALRMHVNDELGELSAALGQAERLLKPGGRLVVVTFHSLEDRIVKRFLVERTGRQPGASRHGPQRSAGSGQLAAPTFRFVNPRPVNPDEAAIAVNPRARSARLRWAVRTEAPA